MEENAITPKTITELKQVTPSDISLISEGVLETSKVMTESTEELEHLSESLNQFASIKYKYDETSKKVRKQMRELIPRL